MGDDAQLLEDAVSTLADIRASYRGEKLGELAALLSHQIAPRMALDSKPDLKEMERIYEQTPLEFADEAAKVVAKRSPAYKTQPFKCIEDYERCKRSSTSKTLCRAALVVCIGKQVLPFVK